MFLYNLVYFFLLKESEHIYYSGFVLSYAFLIATTYGLTDYYFNEISKSYFPSQVFLAGLSLIFAILFGRKFLNLKNNMFIFNKIFDSLIIITALIMIYDIIISNTSSAILILYIISFIAQSCFIVVGIIRYNQGFTVSRFYVFAQSIFILFLFDSFLVNYAIIPVHDLAIRGFLYGSAIEMFLFSVAMVDKVHFLKNEKIEIERQFSERLESKLYERNKELLESEERFKLLSESSFEGIVIHENGIILDVNKYVTDLFGYRLEELLNQNVLRYIHPEDQAVIENAFKNNISDILHFRGVNKSGKIINILSQGRNTFYKGRKVRVVILRDLSTELEIERKYRESEELYRSIISASPDRIVLSDLEGKILYTWSSPAILSFFPLEANEGKNALEFIHPLDRERAVSNFNKLLSNSDTPYKANEYRLLDNQGNIYYVEINSSVVKDADNKISGIISIIRDIKERKEQEIKLLKYYQAIESSPNQIIITKKDGIIEYVNPNFTNVTGYTASEVVNKFKPSILKSGKHSQEFYTNLWETILSGKVWKGEIFNKKKDGNTFWERTLISPVFNSEKEIIYFIAIKEDITEYKQLEQMREDTERIVKHDLKNPISSIILYGEFLKKINTNEKSVKYLNTIILNGNKVLNMINHSLDIFKMEQGTYNFHPTFFDLAEIIRRVVRDSGSFISTNEVVVKIMINEKEMDLYSEINMMGVEPHIYTLFSNLIVNAIEASPNNEEVIIKILEDIEIIQVEIHNKGDIPIDRFLESIV